MSEINTGVVADSINEDALNAVQAEEQILDDAPKRERIVDALGRSYGTGRRKESTARVWFKVLDQDQGSDLFTVNGKNVDEYFSREFYNKEVKKPLLLCFPEGAKFTIKTTVKGGGMTGQCGAVRHGLSRALADFDPELRAALKRKGYLTRDARKVERKKYGFLKARKQTQFRKR